MPEGHSLIFFFLKNCLSVEKKYIEKNFCVCIQLEQKKIREKKPALPTDLVTSIFELTNPWT